MPFSVQAYFDDHRLSVTTETAKDAFARAVEWHIAEQSSNVTISDGCGCRKSNPNILVVQPAQDRAAKNGPGQFDGARDRRILLQR